MRLGRLAYRTRQFAGSLRGGLDPRQRGEIDGLLTGGQRYLFDRMAPAYQRHSFVVYSKLRADGCDELDVLRAGLLHDVGKGRVTLTFRVAMVLLGAIAPRTLEALSAECEPHSWRYALFVAAHHAELGARKLAEAGCSERLVEMVRRHHDAGMADHWSRRLREIDACS